MNDNLRLWGESLVRLIEDVVWLLTALPVVCPATCLDVNQQMSLQKHIFSCS